MSSTEKKGGVCLRYGCSLCCIDTRMPLTRRDIDRIINLGYGREDFIIRENGERRLRNVDGKCFFLQDERCKIYPDRPEGCRTYPLIYYEETGKAEIDTECPHHELFQWTEEDARKLKKLVRTIEEEKG